MYYTLMDRLRNQFCFHKQTRVQAWSRYSGHQIVFLEMQPPLPVEG